MAIRFSRPPVCACAAAFASSLGVASAQPACGLADTVIAADADLGTINSLAGLPGGLAIDLIGSVTDGSTGNLSCLYVGPRGFISGRFDSGGEAVFSLTLTETTLLSIGSDIPGVGQLDAGADLNIYVLQAGATRQPQATALGTLSAATPTLAFLDAPGTPDSPAPLFVAEPGSYLIVVDSQSSPGSPADAVSFDFTPGRRLTLVASSPFDGAACSQPPPGGGALADIPAAGLGIVDLGAIDPALGGLALPIVGSTLGSPNFICAYEDATANPLGRLADGPEAVFSLTLTGPANARMVIENNEGVLAGADHDVYLINAAAASAVTSLIPGLSPPAPGTIARGALGFVDEAGLLTTTGPVPPGDYLLVIDSPAAGAGAVNSGAFDLTLRLTPTPPTTFTPPAGPGDTLGVRGEIITLSTCSPNTDPGLELAVFAVDVTGLTPGELLAESVTGCSPGVNGAEITRAYTPGLYALVISGSPTLFADGFVANRSTQVGGVAEGAFELTATGNGPAPALGPLAGVSNANATDGLFVLVFTIDDAPFNPFIDLAPTPLGMIPFAQGDSLSIITAGSSFDTELALWDMHGNLLAFNDDSGIGTTSRINVGPDIVPEPNGDRDDDTSLPLGTYIIGVSRFNVAYSPAFGVVEVGAPPPSGDVTISLAVVNDPDGPAVPLAPSITQSLPDGVRTSFFSLVLQEPSMGCNSSDLSDTPPGSGVFGQLDGNDISAFVTAFLARDPLADISDTPPGSGAFGQFDGNDISCFVTLFLAGCP